MISTMVSPFLNTNAFMKQTFVAHFWCCGVLWETQIGHWGWHLWRLQVETPDLGQKHAILYSVSI